MAEPDSKFAFDRSKVRTNAILADSASGQPILHNGAIPLQDREVTPDARRDSIRTSCPVEGRVPQPKLNLKRSDRGFDDEPVAPTVVADSPRASARIVDVAPAMSTAWYLIFRRPHEKTVPKKPHLEFDRRAPRFASAD